MLLASTKNRNQSIIRRFFLQGTIAVVATLSSATFTQNTSLAQDPEPAATAPNPDPYKAFEPREFVGTNGKPLKYRLIKPVGYKPGKKYPLVLFLHGAGERGNDNAAQLKHAAKDLCSPELRSKYPAYVLAPQCPNNKKWSEVDWSKDASELPESPSDSMQTIKELLDDMVENAGIDRNRIYITGLSMGGYGTWDAIARYPNFFAAAAPICGGGDPKTVNKFRSLPIWCFHGAKDPVVRVGRSREMVEALKAVGSPIQYTEYPDLQHDSWTKTYANSEFYDWLFAQRRESQ
ncbi:MAG: phospholipase [Planctomycetes bacterium]|nr:phospholipase [Planctomycetota bacterium]